MNVQLPNDQTQEFAILTLDAAGNTVPAPVGDVFSASSGNTASLGVSITALSAALPDGTPAGTPAVLLTPLVQASPGITFTVSDADGLAAFSGAVDIVQDTTPKAIGLDLKNPVIGTQAVPNNPGP